MVYGRDFDDKTLTFEASGALKDAALILRDRETDSWWSIMTSDAIGGVLHGRELVELPVSTKTTWTRWRASHPETQVLSVGGKEHEYTDPYANYWTDDGTFRGTKAGDSRLASKAPIFSFLLGDQAYAVPHPIAEGGAVLKLSEAERLIVWREPGVAMFASTEVWRVPSAAASGRLPKLLDALRRGKVEGAQTVGGFDTFWYTWSAVHPESVLLTR